MMIRLLSAMALTLGLVACFPNIPAEHWEEVRTGMPRAGFPVESGVYQLIEDGKEPLLEETDVFVLRLNGTDRRGQYRFSHTNMFLYPFDEEFALIEFEQGGVFADDDEMKKYSLIMLAKIDSPDQFRVFPALCRDLPDDMLASFGTDKDECSFRKATDIKTAFDLLKTKVDPTRAAVFKRIFPLPDKKD